MTFLNVVLYGLKTGFGVLIVVFGGADRWIVLSFDGVRLISLPVAEL